MRCTRIAAACSLAWVACAAGPAAADTYRDPDDLFSFEVPAGWVRMTHRELAQLRDYARERGGDQTGRLVAGLRPKGTDPGTAPMVLVVVGPGVGRLSYEDMDRDLTKGVVKGLGRAEAELAGEVDDVAVEATSVDRARNRIHIRARATTAAGPVRVWSVSHLASDALVTVRCTTPSDEAARTFADFTKLNDSFQFAPGHEFRAAEGTYESRRQDAVDKLSETLGGVGFFALVLALPLWLYRRMRDREARQERAARRAALAEEDDWDEDEPPRARRVARRAVRGATGWCATCGYAPVAFDARFCPRCGRRNPNPGVANRYAGRGMLIGMAAGAAVGGLLGLASGKPAMALGGALVGVIPGLVAGLFLGLFAALVAWLGGRR